MCAAVKISKFGKFDLNPRGNLWVKDENRFGHKLLSKMGWSNGKGLGKNEDGIAENLKVRAKSGNTGVGWCEKIPLAAENEEYDAVLASLNEKFNSSDNKSKKDDVKSLELRSQQFKKRLHYGKFVRGKDVCRYSEKDMNSIFVMKKPNSEPTLVRVKSTVTNIDSSSTEDEASETTPTFKSHLSMKEYFDMKMKKKPGNTVNSNNKTETIKTEETVKKEVSSKKKSKNKQLKLEPLASDDSSSGGDTVNSNKETETIKTEVTVKNEVSSKKNSKTKQLKLEPQASDDSSRGGNTVNSYDETETIKTEETVKKEVSSKKKSKTKQLKLEPQASDDSSNGEETLKHSFNSTESGIVEKPSSKKDISSRKRSKTDNKERPKRLKLDPDLVEEYSPTNSCTGKESDDILEVSSNAIESSETSCRTIAGEEQHEVESAPSKKKRKKAEKRKRIKTETVDISEESTSPEPNEEELKDDLVLLGEFPQSEIQILSKKYKKPAPKKSKKAKSDALTKLKTCLKGSWNYSLEKESRKVSFNENVFYRILNSDTEGDIKTECPNESDISEPVVCLTADKSIDESLAEDLKEVTASALAENGAESALSTDVQNVEESCDVESDGIPNCMNLPKCNNSNYNSWLENQRLATKMKLYQNMIKKMKKHPVLKTSNLLDLKGYGNWGF